MDKNKQKWNVPVCCESCKAYSKSGEEFRKLVTLNNSGLTVFINTAGKTDANKMDSIILHNVGNKTLEKPDFYAELSRRKTKCYLCNTLIQKVCNLVNEVREMKENEMIAICEHCKRSNATNKCKRCDEVMKKFLKNQINEYEYRQQALKVRLYEVRRILSLIVDKKNICDHKICQAYYDSNAELKILLELIKSPIPSNRPDVEEYLSLMEKCKDSMEENMENDLFLKFSGLVYESKKSLDNSTSESRSNSFCICKYLRNRNIESAQSLTLSPSTLEPISENISPKKHVSQEKLLNVLKDFTGKSSAEKKKLPSVLKDITEKSSAEKNILLKKKEKDKEPKNSNKKKSSEKKKTVKGDDIENDIENISLNKQTKRRSVQEKKKSLKLDADYKMMMKLIKDKDKEKKRAEQNVKKQPIPTMPKIEELPKIKVLEKKIEKYSETSDSILECGQGEPINPLEIIQGNRIIPFVELHKLHSHDKEPVVFKIKHNFTPAEKTSTKTANSTPEQTVALKNTFHPSVDTLFPGIIKYELSNKKFIEKGWTQLPSTKVVRRMNIYKMIPANPQFDWFANHKKRNLFYNSGEKLAEVDKNSCGRWFYKNGRVALEYYKTKDINAGLKCVVYDIDDKTEGKKNKQRNILASFDHLGNGIVYDHIGNARLKYNQSEGLVIDKILGPPGKWKWHSLNDPPILQQVYIDNVEEKDKCFKGVVKQHIHDSDLTKRVICEKMVALEFENFVKEKACKMLQSYKPFEIRMKTVKLNEYFSVRIINQANIQLLFRCNQASLKVNMGMLLVSNEIVDTSVSDVMDVATPFDRPISGSESGISI